MIFLVRLEAVRRVTAISTQLAGLLEEDSTEFGMGMGDMAFNDVVEYFRQLERVKRCPSAPSRTPLNVMGTGCFTRGHRLI